MSLFVISFDNPEIVPTRGRFERKGASNPNYTPTRVKKWLANTSNCSDVLCSSYPNVSVIIDDTDVQYFLHYI